MSSRNVIDLHHSIYAILYSATLFPIKFKLTFCVLLEERFDSFICLKVENTLFTVFANVSNRYVCGGHKIQAILSCRQCDRLGIVLFVFIFVFLF